MVIVGLFAGVMGAAAIGGGGALFALLYLVIAGLYCVPIYHLYKFSTDMNEALQNRRTYTLDSAFESLKSHYKFIGIFTIVIISLYILIFLGSLAAL